MGWRPAAVSCRVQMFSIAQLLPALAENLFMNADPKIERHAAHNAFLAGLAEAAGDYALAQRYIDSMMRAWLLLRPLDVRVIYNSERAVT